MSFSEGGGEGGRTGFSVHDMTAGHCLQTNKRSV